MYDDDEEDDVAVIIGPLVFLRDREKDRGNKEVGWPGRESAHRLRMAIVSRRLQHVRRGLSLSLAYIMCGGPLRARVFSHYDRRRADSP